MSLTAALEPEPRHPDLQWLLMESGGDKLVGEFFAGADGMPACSWTMGQMGTKLELLSITAAERSRLACATALTSRPVAGTAPGRYGMSQWTGSRPGMGGF